MRPSFLRSLQTAKIVLLVVGILAAHGVRQHADAVPLSGGGATAELAVAAHPMAGAMAQG